MIIIIILLEDATYIDSSIYGYGDKQIIGDTWLIKMNGTINYATTSRGDCVPLTGHIFMQEPRKLLFYLQNKSFSFLFSHLAMVSGSTTTNFVPRIDDSSIFDIPSECQKFF